MCFFASDTINHFFALLTVVRSMSRLGLRKHVSCLHTLCSTHIHSGNYFPFRTNRTHLKDDFYAVGALKKGPPTDADFDEDLLTFLGIESLS